MIISHYHTDAENTFRRAGCIRNEDALSRFPGDSVTIAATAYINQWFSNHPLLPALPVLPTTRAGKSLWLTELKSVMMRDDTIVDATRNIAK